MEKDQMVGQQFIPPPPTAHPKNSITKIFEISVRFAGNPETSNSNYTDNTKILQTQNLH